MIECSDICVHWGIQSWNDSWQESSHSFRPLNGQVWSLAPLVVTDDRVDTGLSSTVMPTETHSSKILFHLESKGDDFSGPTRWEINSTITPWFPLEIGLTPWKTHFPSTRSQEVQRPWELASVLIPPYQFAPLRLSCALPGGKASSSIPAIKWSVKLCFPSSCFIPHSHIEFLSSDFLYFFGSFLSYFKPNPKQSRIFFQD